MQNPNAIPLARKWFFLSIASLAIAGLFSLPPAILRGPFFEQLFNTQHIFDVSLVIHVNMSVLVWILAIGGMMTVMHATNRFVHVYALATLCFYLCLGGTVLMTLGALVPDTQAIKSNYIPMLTNIVFIIGLSVFACGILGQAILAIPPRFPTLSQPLNLSLCSAAVIILIAMGCFMIAGTMLPNQPDDLAHFYEQLFWGGGHALQFTFTSLLIATWLKLADHTGLSLLVKNKYLSIIILCNLLFAGICPFIYKLYPSIEDTIWPFTLHMRWLGGIAPVTIGLIIVGSFLTSNNQSPLPYIKHGLLWSILFFGYGGLLGVHIGGMDTTVPAHYHASVVGGITMAFMTLCYTVVPTLLDKAFTQPRAAMIQLYLYGIGHVLHITGLAVMGGYGALRKTAGNSAQVDTIIGKALFFGGAPLALIGGLMFVIVIYKAYRKPQ